MKKAFVVVLALVILLPLSVGGQTRPPIQRVVYPFQCPGSTASAPWEFEILYVDAPGPYPGPYYIPPVQFHEYRDGQAALERYECLRMVRCAQTNWRYIGLTTTNEGTFITWWHQ